MASQSARRINAFIDLSAKCTSSATELIGTPKDRPVVISESLFELFLIETTFKSISLVYTPENLPVRLRQLLESDGEAEACRMALEDLVDLLNPGLRGKRGFDDLHSPLQTVANFQNALANAIRRPEGPDVEKCMELLGPENDAKIHKKAVNTVIKGTGQEFLNSREFLTWVDGPSQTLFCPGSPGVGKTMMTSIAIDKVRLHFSDDPEIGIASLYLGDDESNQPRKNEMESCVRRLLRQFVVCGKEKYDLPSLWALVDEHSVVGAMPHYEELRKALHTVMRNFRRTYIFIDSLNVLNSLGEIMAMFHSFQVDLGTNMFYTSRPEPSVEKFFTDVPALTIRPTTEDVLRVLDAEMKKMPDGMRLDPELQLQIKAMVTDGVDGMFKVVSGNLDGLVGKSTSPDMELQFSTGIPNTRSLVFGLLLGEPSLLDKLHKSPHTIDVFNSAVDANSVGFLEAMLLKGVSVSGRAMKGKQRSPLEVACTPSRCTAATFELLLQYATKETLDKLDSSNQGLIHHLIDPTVFQRDLKLQALLYKGADPDLKRWKNKVPALVAYILDRQINPAMILLDHGADPRATSKEGMDATLAAASRGSIKLLERLTMILANTHYDWGRTCLSHFTILHPGGARSTTTASKCNALHLAAFNGHDLTLQFYFEKVPKVDVNAKVIDSHRQPLHFAAAGGAYSCLKLLVENGADLEARTMDGSTPLHVAVRAGQRQAVELLLQLGPAHPVDKNNLTPLFYALDIGVKEIVEMFFGLSIATPPSRDSTERKDQICRAVKMVISKGNLDHCKMLLKATSAKEIRTAYLECGKCSALTYAIRKQHGHIVNWLLDLGCEGFIGSCLDHSLKDKRGFNALNDICEKPRLLKCISPILDAYLKASISWTSMEAGALHSCAMSDNAEGISKVMQHLAENALEYRRKFWFGEMAPSPNSCSVSPSKLADMSHHVLNQPLMATSEVDNNDVTHVTHERPLHAALIKGNLEAAKRLLDLGADKNATDDNQQSPLIVATRLNDTEGVGLLVSKHANVNMYDHQGYTPIMVATDQGSLPIVRQLIDAGADIHARDAEGMGLLSIAAEKTKNPALFRFLLDQGLDPRQRDKTGLTPLHDLILNSNMTSYLVGSDLDICQVDELPKGLLSLVVDLNRGNADSILRRLPGKIPQKKLKDMINYYPERFVSCLVAAVITNEIAAIHTLIRYGADVNKKGTVEGSPLMAACAKGRFDAVKVLVQYGAWIEYTENNNGRKVIRNGIELAHNFPNIQHWLLVGRYTDDKLMKEAGDAGECQGARGA